MVIDLVMGPAPYPAGSRASISPPAAVLEIAPAKVLQGAVRLQGLASSPTPDTQVRLACALAKLAPNRMVTANVNRFLFTDLLLLSLIVCCSPALRSSGLCPTGSGQVL